MTQVPDSVFRDVRLLLDSILEGSTDEALLQVQKTFEYLGFNPIAFAHLILSKSPDTWQRDVPDMIVLYLTRGTKVVANKRRTPAEGIARIDELVRKYEIKATRGGGAQDYAPNDVTLSRVAAAFPLHTTAILHRLKPARVVGEQIPGLPLAYHWPGGAAAIPNDNDALHDLWTAYAVSFDKIIRPKVKDSDKQRKTKVQNFQHQMRISKAVTEDAKKDLLARLMSMGQVQKAKRTGDGD